MTTNRKKKLAEDFKNIYHKQEQGNYQTAAESMTLEDKIQVLDDMGKPELIDLFKEWRPKVSNRRKRGPALDQRVSITVTSRERVTLDAELKEIKRSGGGVSMSQFIRNRAIGTVDINGWKEIAEKALEELDYTEKNRKQLIKERDALAVMYEEEDDNDEASLYAIKISNINVRLKKLVAQNEKRSNRLSGRMSMPEAETVKWRAQRLCISTSDYLRMMIFSLTPDSTADSHMSIDAKKRFYISIIDVAINGWGTPPTIYECSQCENYMEEIRRLRLENEQLANFA